MDYCTRRGGTVTLSEAVYHHGVRVAETEPNAVYGKCVLSCLVGVELHKDQLE